MKTIEQSNREAEAYADRVAESAMGAFDAQVEAAPYPWRELMKMAREDTKRRMRALVYKAFVAGRDSAPDDAP